MKNSIVQRDDVLKSRTLFDFWSFVNSFDSIDLNKLSEKIEAVFGVYHEQLIGGAYLFVAQLTFKIEQRHFKFDKVYVAPDDYIVERGAKLRRVFFSDVEVNGIYQIVSGKVVSETAVC